MFTTIEMFECSNCGKLYKYRPPRCVCEEKLEVGLLVGPFKLIGRHRKDHWQVECKLCGMFKTTHRTNLRRSTSCGCKPRHIKILKLYEDEVKYKCLRCNEVSKVGYPVLEWCCDVE